MARTMPAGLMTLLARQDKRIKSYTTLQVLIDNGDVLKHYRFASAELEIEGAAYEAQLKRASQIKSSLGRAADSATVELQNVDNEIGREFLGLGQALYGAQTKIGRYWEDLESGAVFHKVFLTGPLVGYSINQDVATITAVSDPYANISVGATRRVTNSCQWQFRNPFTCGYAGPLLICDFTLNGAGGCEGRHGDPLKRAKFGGFAYLNSKSRLVTS